MSGAPDPRWFHRPEDAREDVKRRLGVERLHDGKRFDAYERPLEESAQTHEGHEWRCVSYINYGLPPSHPDHGRSGGVRVYTMDREMPVFDPSTIKFG
jgi:hypothetical protein